MVRKVGGVLRRPAIVAALLALMPLRGVGAEVSFQASVDRETVSLADQVTLTLEVIGTRDGAPQLPEIKGAEILGRSSQTEFSLVNGATSVRQIFRYTLIPLQAGELRIPPAKLVADGRTFLTRPLTVKVVSESSSAAAAKAPRPEPAQAPGGRSPLFIRTEVDRNEVFVNQQVNLVFRLYYAAGLKVGDLNYEEPPTVGFVSPEVNPREDRFNLTIEGTRYQVLELKKAIFPISPGSLKIGPAGLRGNVYRRSRRSPAGFFGDDFFPDPFATEREPFRLRSDPIEITVKPLPPGAPASFSGAVGVYEMKVEVSPRKVKVGEPVTLAVTIQGLGSLDTVVMPQIRYGEVFRGYEPEVSASFREVGGRMGGTKVFRQALIPLQEGSIGLPEVSFSFFDPESGRYREISLPAGTIEAVEAPAGSRTVRVEAGSPGTGRQVEIVEKDILYIKKDPGKWRRSVPGFWLRREVWALQIVPVLLLLGAWRYQARRRRLSTDRIYARKVGASRSVRRRFAAARRLLEQGDKEAFCRELNRAFTRYLGDRLGLPSGAVDPEVAARRLEGAGLPPGTLECLNRCFATGDRVRYCPGVAAREEMRRWLEEAEDVVSRLEKVKL